jgi:Zn-dependent peptidase ImmA (M78 family)/transcriptional regulator with XRE-family HTH domain
MAQPNPISQNIRRIRISHGLSQEDAAIKAGISRNAYRSIETGQAEPRVSSLQGIARALGVALPELLTEPPRLSSVRFRSTKTRSGKNQARRDQVVVQMARWLKDFNSLEESLGQKMPYLMDGLMDTFGDASNPIRPIEAAGKAREVLGLKDNEPIHDICGLLQSAGVKVLTQKLPIEDLFGLSVAIGDGGPAVVVNIRDDIPVERRIFTAAHEFGHLLLHPRAYDMEQVKEDTTEETEAHLFAAHFLMPDKTFQDEWRDSYGLPFVDRVLHVKRIFHVSYMTVLYRLIDSGQVDSTKIWMIFKAQWKRRSGKALTKKVEPMALADVDFLEDRLSRLVRQAIESERITISRGAEILGFDLNTMRDMIASWEVAA